MSKQTKDVVVIPAWRRPELLALTLESLAAARHADEHLFLFMLDQGQDPMNEAVIERFRLTTHVVFQDDRYAATDACNTLEGYRHAINLAVSLHNAGSAPWQEALVYMIQEDVLVTRDFFEFHRAAHRRDMSPVSAIPIQKWITNAPPPSPGTLFTSRRYHPWAVSWKAGSLDLLVLPHARIEFYKDQLDYVRRAFPESKIGHGQGEQDWLIDNEIQTWGIHCILPTIPRAFHAGWWSDRREAWHPRSQDLWERVEECRQILANPTRLSAITGYADVKPVDLAGHGVKESEWKLVK